MVQGELFREDTSSSIGLDRVKKSFLSRHQLTLSLDKIVLLFIATVVTFALTYSFGVESGKRAVEKNFESLIPTHSETVSLNVEPVTPAPAQETVLLVNQSPTDEIFIPGSNPATESSETTELAVTMEAEPVLPAIPNAKPNPPIPIVDMTKKGSFTVQLVTYADEKQALREINRLKTKGQDGFVIMSGKYYQVCANYFEDKTKARSFLKRFSDLNRYPDAYIRPVVR